MNGDDLTRVDYLKKEYGHFKTVNKERQFIPLVPQPSPDSILELHRNYSTLKLESTYKRRVSYFGKIPSSLTNIIPIAVVEYTCKFPGRAPHRKSTKLTQDYIRTPANVMEKIGNLTQGNQQSRLIYNKLILESDTVCDGPKNLKQIYNKKYYDKTSKTTGYTSNFADQLQQITNMIHEHPMIQQVHHSKGYYAFHYLVHN